MPDRDFAFRAVGRQWAPACRLYVLDGATDAAASRASTVLARMVREEARTKKADYVVASVGLDEATTEEIDRIEHLLSASLLAPSRTLLIENGRDFDEIGAQEQELFGRLKADIEHLARQKVAGVTPRRAPHRRPSLQAVVSRSVKVQLDR